MVMHRRSFSDKCNRSVTRLSAGSAQLLQKVPCVRASYELLVMSLSCAALQQSVRCCTSLLLAGPLQVHRALSEHQV
jgi:hypothetical protein